MSTVIRVEDLSKQYRLGQVGRGTINHDVNRWWHKVRGKEDPYLKIGQENDRTIKGNSDYVWSLQNINFDVKEGEVLGIIGRNGAGKSTLLKVLSKVTTPTLGEVKIKGRVASLLEVGTGFHPDLSGRDNIFLNGAILGMTKREIQKKFDEIVDFAGVERYIDTPVKRYSSGMYVRLAFAVAAHLEPEILIVDEVLAVGDAEFQKKCLGKMKDVSTNEGRTVLFVSHHMGSISRLCNKAILLHNGKLVNSGATETIIKNYLETTEGLKEPYAFLGDEKKHEFYIDKFDLFDSNDTSRREFGTNESITIGLELVIKKYQPGVEFAIALMDKKDNRVFTIHEDIFTNDHHSTGKRNIQLEIHSGYLAPGKYSWIAAVHIPNQVAFHVIENICNFSIIDSGTKLSGYEGTDMGVLIPKYNIRYS